MSYENENFNDPDSEVLSPDGKKVSGLLQSLKRVEAPKDFDYRLKARIANVSPADHRPASFFPVLRYVLPLGLFLMTGGALMWNGGMNVNNDTVSTVAETVRPITPPAAVQSEPVNERSREMAASIPPTVETVPVIAEPAAFRKSRNFPSRIQRISVSGSGSSVDMALREAPKTILPRGFDGVVTTVNNTNTSAEIPRQFTAGEVLSTIGVEAKFESKGWKVGAVSKGSMAESAGIQAGDSIESIDGKPLGNKKVFTGPFNAKTLNVIRDSKNLEIKMKP